MKRLILLFYPLLFLSCIPIKKAPSIENHKVELAKRFNRDLPRDYAFIFEDTKDAHEFYKFIIWKFALNYENVANNVPIQFDDQVVFLSFFEREKRTKLLNIFAILIDMKRESNGNEPLLEGHYTESTAHWYILITVKDEQIKDCLSPSHKDQKKVITFLKELKREYQNKNYYVQTHLKQE